MALETIQTCMSKSVASDKGGFINETQIQQVSFC